MLSHLRLALLVPLFSLLIGVPSASYASTVVKLDIPAMTRLSSWVVRAHVTKLTGIDHRSTGGSLYTDVTLRLDAIFKGDKAQQTLTMRLPGGVGKDGLALTVPGMPTFTVGEETILFLEMTALGPVPSGMEQGVWRIFRAPFGFGVALKSTANVALVEPNAQGALVPAPHGSSVHTKLLAQLEREIQAAVASQR